jgi:HAD superfamily hydrolase (TIGR01509 family)
MMTAKMILLSNFFLLCCICSIHIVPINAFSNNPRPLVTSVFSSKTKTTTTKTVLFGKRKKNNNNNNNINTNPPATAAYEFALLFDCDGVILETEELHRKAYNRAFYEAGVKIVSSRAIAGNSNLAISEDPVVWSVEYYDILQNSVGGGKPKMRHYFKEVLNNIYGDDVVDVKIVAGDQQWNKQDLNTKEGIEKLDALIDELQENKTGMYKETVEENAETRPGILDLMDEAIRSKSIAVGVCSASTKEAVTKVLSVTLGPDRVRSLDVCILGDDVSEKKPSPMIYNEARKSLGINDPKKCVVIEDSAVGLRAAKSAGMRCIITYTDSTAAEDFYEEGADAKVPNLRANGQVTLDSIFDPMRDGNWKNEPELLVDIRDGIDSFESIPEPMMINIDTGAVTSFDDEPQQEPTPFFLQSDDEEYNENAIPEPVMKNTDTVAVTSFDDEPQNGAQFSLQSDDQEYNEIAVNAPVPEIAPMDTAGGTMKSPPNQQELAPRSTSRRLQLYEDDMGNLSMERPSYLKQIEKEQKETFPGFKPVAGCFDM